MTSFEDGLKEAVADGLIDQFQVDQMFAAEKYAEENSFDLPADADLSPSREFQIQQAKKNYTVVELKTLCKESKISRYSKLNETALIELLLDSGIKL